MFEHDRKHSITRARRAASLAALVRNPLTQEAPSV